MRRYVVVLFVVIICANSFATGNLREGYILKADKDTVFGLIDFRSDEENMRSVKFKPAGENTLKQFFPGDILGYRLIEEGKYYVSKEIAIRNDSAQLVFVEFLVQGLKNLYYYSEKGNSKYLIEDNSGKLFVISKKPDLMKDGHVFEDNKYKGLLKYVFKEFESIQQKAEKAKFIRKDMINLTKEYHNNVCQDGSDCIVFENDYSKKFVNLNFSVYTSLLYHQLMVYTMYQNRDKDLYAYSTVPEIGVQLSVFSPRVSTSFGLYADLSFCKLHATNDNFVLNTGLTNPYNVYEYSAYRANAILGIKYLFNSRKLRPSIEIGFIGGYMFDPENRLRIYKTDQSSPVIYQEFNNYLLPDPFRGGYACAFQLDYKLKNKNYVFAKLGYYNTVALQQYFEPYYIVNNKKEHALQFKIGYTL